MAMERWECFAELEIGPKHSDHRIKFEDAATMQYPDSWSPERCAAEFLIAVAKEIEQGTLLPTETSDDA